MSAVDIEQLQPISRTYQYRKVMKPMLERKRRARINRCLDELKELMLSALQADGENVSKLEKADILELTVQHLHKLRRQHRLALNPVTESDRFRAGYTHCASEVSKCLASTPGIDVKLGTKLMSHLGHRLNTSIGSVTAASSPITPRNSASFNGGGGSHDPLTIRISPFDGTVSPAPSSPSSIASAVEYNMPLTPSSSGSASSPPSEYGDLLDMSVKSPNVWRPW